MPHLMGASIYRQWKVSMKPTLYSVKFADMDQLKEWASGGNELAKKELKDRLIATVEGMTSYWEAVGCEIKIIEK